MDLWVRFKNFIKTLLLEEDDDIPAPADETPIAKTQGLFSSKHGGKNISANDDASLQIVIAKPNNT